tara:strand:- start:2066 stop:2185 length:120 start_codon:yes stop_codon:yes gene_type:complete
MKKIVFIVALCLVALVAQSCCAVSNCPGLAQAEVSNNNA